jgi:hypothetical protein
MTYSNTMFISRARKTIVGLLTAVFLFGAATSEAQIRVPFTTRTTPATIKLKGDFAMTGNSNLTLVDYSDNGSNNANMEYIDIDGDNTTFNSSSADLVFSQENGASAACSEIIYAGLYWSGRSSNSSDSPNIFTVTKNSVTKTFDKRKVLFKAPGMPGYVEKTAADDDIYYPVNSDGFMYSAFVDVTADVQQYGPGAYTVADIALVEGNGGGTGYYGGWGMVVIYENYLMNWRDITIFDGHSYVAGSVTADFTIPVSGFQTAPAGDIDLKIGMMAGEGDRGISGDFFEIRNAADNAWVRLNHGGNSKTIISTLLFLLVRQYA